MIIKYDLSKEGIEKYERENLLYTIDEMLAMDNKQRWADLIVITHPENWLEDNKKIITAQVLMYLIELEKGRLDSTMGKELSFIEQFLIVKWAKEKVTTGEISYRVRRDINTIRRVLRVYGATSNLRTPPKPVVIVTSCGQKIEVNNAREASDTTWCHITANALRQRLYKHGFYTNDVATFYYKEDEEKWN